MSQITIVTKTEIQLKAINIRISYATSTYMITYLKDAPTNWLISRKYNNNDPPAATSNV